MNNLVNIQSAGTKALQELGPMGDNDDLSGGVTGGFGVISIRGSKWRIKSGGEETLLTNAEGDAQAAIRVVILKANPALSKIYYESNYVEGSSEEPDCFSIDGESPDPSVLNPYSVKCANCSKNIFGSRITEAGKKSKACSDSRRIVVLPEGDFANERFGGPMLLRVPAASLTELATYGKQMKQKGYPYNTVITKVYFDPDTAYPRLKFQAARPITEEETTELTELLRDSSFVDKVSHILAQPIEVQEAPAAQAAPKVQDPTEFEDDELPPPVVAKVQPVSAKPKSKTPVPVAKVEAAAPAPVSVPDDLDSILAKLDDLN